MSSTMEGHRLRTCASREYEGKIWRRTKVTHWYEIEYKTGCLLLLLTKVIITVNVFSLLFSIFSLSLR